MRAEDAYLYLKIVGCHVTIRTRKQKKESIAIGTSLILEVPVMID